MKKQGDRDGKTKILKEQTEGSGGVDRKHIG
jgi:hypothetical protein